MNQISLIVPDVFILGWLTCAVAIVIAQHIGVAVDAWSKRYRLQSLVAQRKSSVLIQRIARDSAGRFISRKFP